MLDNFEEYLNNLVSERFAEVAKQRLTDKDPTIDWSKVKVIADFKTEQFFFESDDEETTQKLKAAKELVKTDLDNSQA